MTVRFVIEALLVVAVIIGFCFEEKIARAERRFLRKVLCASRAKKQRQEHIKLKMREARYQRQQLQREMELLELGLDTKPSLKVMAQESAASALDQPQEEVA